jgi:hypothetical protein
MARYSLLVATLLRLPIDTTTDPVDLLTGATQLGVQSGEPSRDPPEVDQDQPATGSAEHDNDDRPDEEETSILRDDPRDEQRDAEQERGPRSDRKDET